MNSFLPTLVFRFNRAIHRFLLRWLKQPRPGSTPYLSGDTFRQLADHIYDETGGFQPESVMAGEIIFVKTDLLEKYFTDIHPLIQFPYKLISHNSDRNITKKELSYIDEKIIHWYGQNVTVSHPKLTPLPIGLENLHIYLNGIVDNFSYWRKKQTSGKKNLILFGFNVQTNPVERQAAITQLRQTGVAEEIISPLIPPAYVAHLNQYHFVASPTGNGLDCHRTWEALYLGVIPIVKRSVASEFFASLQLPIWLIDDWSEMTTLTEITLKKRYEEILARSKTDALFITYWEKLIRERS